MVCFPLYLSLFVYRSLSLSVSISVCLSVCLSLYLCLSVSVSLSHSPLLLMSNTEASRRDDLESLGYSLIHLLRAGRGLWSDDSNYLEAVNREGSFDVRTTRSKMLQFKLSHTVNELCHDLPSTYVDPLSHTLVTSLQWSFLITSLWSAHWASMRHQTMTTSSPFSVPFS
jgi:hypothetical protein